MNFSVITNNAVLRIVAFLLVIALYQATNTQVFCQIRNVTIGAGLTTINFGDSPSSKSMFSDDTTNILPMGGSFDGNQPGFSFRMTFAWDENARFVTPIGFDYGFLRANERVPLSKTNSAYFSHSIDIPSVFTGLNYFFMKFPLANARAFIGLEGRATFVGDDHFSFDIDEPVPVYDKEKKDTIFLRPYSTSIKKATTRIGAAVRLGVEGEISSPWYVHASVAWGAMNLFGRSNERKELLTPKLFYEVKESIVRNFLFSLLIQYKI